MIVLLQNTAGLFYVLNNSLQLDCCTFANARKRFCVYVCRLVFRSWWGPEYLTCLTWWDTFGWSPERKLLFLYKTCLEGFLLFPEVKVRVNFRCQWKNSKTNVSFCVYVLNSIKHSS